MLKKTAGVDVVDPSLKETVFERYVQAFNKGAYNMIKKERDTVTDRLVKRKYFSGGVDASISSSIEKGKTRIVSEAEVERKLKKNGKKYIVRRARLAREQQRLMGFEVSKEDSEVVSSALTQEELIVKLNQLEKLYGEFLGTRAGEHDYKDILRDVIKESKLGDEEKIFLLAEMSDKLDEITEKFGHLPVPFDTNVDFEGDTTIGEVVDQLRRFISDSNAKTDQLKEIYAQIIDSLGEDVKERAKQTRKEQFSKKLSAIKRNFFTDSSVEHAINDDHKRAIANNYAGSAKARSDIEDEFEFIAQVLDGMPDIIEDITDEVELLEETATVEEKIKMVETKFEQLVAMRNMEHGLKKAIREEVGASDRSDIEKRKLLSSLNANLEEISKISPKVAGRVRALEDFITKHKDNGSKGKISLLIDELMVDLREALGMLEVSNVNASAADFKKVIDKVRISSFKQVGESTTEFYNMFKIVTGVEPIDMTDDVEIIEEEETPVVEEKVVSEQPRDATPPPEVKTPQPQREEMPKPKKSKAPYIVVAILIALLAPLGLQMGGVVDIPVLKDLLGEESSMLENDENQELEGLTNFSFLYYKKIADKVWEQVDRSEIDKLNKKVLVSESHDFDIDNVAAVLKNLTNSTEKTLSGYIDIELSNFDDGEKHMIKDCVRKIVIMRIKENYREIVLIKLRRKDHLLDDSIKQDKLNLVRDRKMHIQYVLERKKKVESWSHDKFVEELHKEYNKYGLDSSSAIETDAVPEQPREATPPPEVKTPQPQTAAMLKPKKSKTGLIAGVLAAVLALGGAGAYFGGVLDQFLGDNTEQVDGKENKGRDVENAKNDMVLYYKRLAPKVIEQTDFSKLDALEKALAGSNIPDPSKEEVVAEFKRIIPLMDAKTEELISKEFVHIDSAEAMQVSDNTGTVILIYLKKEYSNSTLLKTGWNFARLQVSIEKSEQRIILETKRHIQYRVEREMKEKGWNNAKFSEELHKAFEKYGVGDSSSAIEAKKSKAGLIAGSSAILQAENEVKAFLRDAAQETMIDITQPAGQVFVAWAKNGNHRTGTYKNDSGEVLFTKKDGTDVVVEYNLNGRQGQTTILNVFEQASSVIEAQDGNWLDEEEIASGFYADGGSELGHDSQVRDIQRLEDMAKWLREAAEDISVEDENLKAENIVGERQLVQLDSLVPVYAEHFPQDLAGIDAYQTALSAVPYNLNIPQADIITRWSTLDMAVDALEGLKNKIASSSVGGINLKGMLDAYAVKASNAPIQIDPAIAASIPGLNFVFVGDPKVMPISQFIAQ